MLLKNLIKNISMTKIYVSGLATNSNEVKKLHFFCN